MDTETSNAIERVNDRIERLEISLRAEIREVRGEVAESRRHTQVLFESLRDDIRIVAEGVAVLAVKIDRRS